VRTVRCATLALDECASFRVGRIAPLAIVPLLTERWTRLEGPRVVAQERLELERRDIRPALAEYDGFSD